MSRPIIEVRNLTKRYSLGAVGATSLREEASRIWDRLRGVPHPDARDFWALRDVSFDVRPGEVVGVIGRNGAGKSTLLKILSRITEPTSGTATLRGRVASLLEVGTGFHPELTGRENVFLNGAILGMTRAEVRKKFDEIVAFAEVDQFIDTPVKRYSSGMYVRLAFAVAAHLEPEILIVDEVLAVGDIAFQQKCLGKIQDVASGEGRTVFLVSHNMAAIQQLCPRVIFLQDGRVKFEGSTVRAIETYFRNPHAGKSTGLIDLRGATRRPKSSDTYAIFTAIEMRNSQGDTAAEVMTGEPFELILTVDAQRALPHAIVGFSVKSIEGIALFTSHWDDRNSTKDLPNGLSVIRCEIQPAILRPGKYFVDLGIVDSAFRPHDFLGDAFSFTVGDVAFPGTPKLDRRPGSITVNFSWTTTP